MRPKKSNLRYALLFIAALFFSSSFGQNTFHTTTKSVIGFLEYLPKDYNSNSDKYPVVFFLHGLGERGPNTKDIAAIQAGIGPVEKNGPPKYTKAGTDFPFILISPQLKNNWTDWPISYVQEVIEYCKTYLRIDERRIYITGLSLGGGGTWTNAQTYPQMFAAIAPVCGSRNTPAKANLIAAENLPVWAFHGDADTTVPVNRSIAMVNAINSFNPNPPALITIYPGVNHNCWDRAYRPDHTLHNPNVYEWMLSYVNTTNGTNKIPVADAGADATKNLSASNVVLSGSGSDTDGTIASYAWSQISGPSTATLTNATTSTLTASNLSAGTYVFKLKVTDNIGDADADYVTVNVTSNAAPTVNAGTDKTITLPTSTVTLAGSASDSDGTISSYQWTQVSGGSATLTGATTATLTASTLVEGTYVFRLTAKDNAGDAKSDDVTVTVETAAASSNIAPVADAGPDRLVKLPSDPITLFGVASDADGTIAKYSWTKVSGGACTFTSTTVLRPKVSGLESGTYVFRLTITDNGGTTASDDVTITVDQSPVVNAGADQTITLPQNSVTLTGTASDADGTITSYLWAKSAGPASASISSKNAATTSVSGLVAGTYEFRLTVTDNDGAQTIDYITVVVQDAAASSTARSAMSTTTASTETSAEPLTLSTEGAYATIYSEPGQKIYEGQWNSEIYKQVLNQKGLYFYKLMKDGKQASGKVYIN